MTQRCTSETISKIKTTNMCFTTKSFSSFHFIILSLSLLLWQPCSVFWQYRFAFLEILYKWNYTKCILLCLGYFISIIIWDPFLWLHVSIIHFLLLSIKQSITWICHNLFIYSPLDDLWTELTYGLSWTRLLWRPVYKSLHGHVPSFILRKYLRVEWLFQKMYV